MLFGEVCPEISHEIGQFFYKFVPKNPAKIDFFLRNLSEALLVLLLLLADLHVCGQNVQHFCKSSDCFKDTHTQKQYDNTNFYHPHDLESGVLPPPGLIMVISISKYFDIILLLYCCYLLFIIISLNILFLKKKLIRTFKNIVTILHSVTNR